MLDGSGSNAKVVVAELDCKGTEFGPAFDSPFNNP